MTDRAEGKSKSSERRRSTLPVEVDRRQGDRRRAKRLPLELWVEQEEGDALYFKRAANLSPGGVYFERTLPEPVGTRVRLRFTLPGDDGEISCDGEIVAAKPGEMGASVRFVGLAADARKKIEALIDGGSHQKGR
jgi:hypothetical protein